MVVSRSWCVGVEITWHQVKVTWHQVRSHDIRVRSHDIRWDHMTSGWGHMTSGEVTRHQVRSHDIRWGHMTSGEVTWHQVRSHDIRWSHMTSGDDMQTKIEICTWASKVQYSCTYFIPSPSRLRPLDQTSSMSTCAPLTSTCGRESKPLARKNSRDFWEWKNFTKVTHKQNIHYHYW